MLAYFYEIQMPFAKSASKTLSPVESTAKYISLRGVQIQLPLIQDGLDRNSFLSGRFDSVRIHTNGQAFLKPTILTIGSSGQVDKAILVALTNVDFGPEDTSPEENSTRKATEATIVGMASGLILTDLANTLHNSLCNLGDLDSLHVQLVQPLLVLLLLHQQQVSLLTGMDGNRRENDTFSATNGIPIGREDSRKRHLGSLGSHFVKLSVQVSMPHAQTSVHLTHCSKTPYFDFRDKPCCEKGGKKWLRFFR